MTILAQHANLADVSQSASIIGTAEVSALLGWSVAKVKREALAERLPVHAKLPGETGAYLFERSAIEALCTASQAAAS